MKILIVDDRGSAAIGLKDYLVNIGHQVVSTASILHAMTIDIYKVDLLIVDLNMSPLGLSSDEEKKSFDGMFTGWIWLSNYVYNERKSMRNRTIIFSDYVQDLVHRFPDEKFEGIKFLSKRLENTPKKIVAFIDSIDLGID
jgi:two-component SAPR family response regulator